MKTWQIRNWKTDLVRAGAGGLGSVSALAMAGWPNNDGAAWIGLVGFIAGLMVAFVAEYIVSLHLEVRHLGNVDGELDGKRMQMAELQRLHENQLAIARREAAISAVEVEVWGGAYEEALKGIVLPLAAILARQSVLIKSRNLDQPIPQDTHLLNGEGTDQHDVQKRHVQ